MARRVTTKNNEVQSHARKLPGLRGPPWLVALAIMAWEFWPKKNTTHGVEQDSGCQEDDDQRERERVSADILDALENLNRGDTGEIKHQRNAEFGERPYENNNPPGEDARHDERQGDSAEFAKSGAAKVDGRFLHSGIDVGQGGDDVEIEDRVEMERVEDYDSPEPSLAQPVDGMVGIHQATRFKKGIEGSLLSEDLLDSDGSHKGRQDHGNEHEPVEEGFCGKQKTVTDPGQWDGYDSR